jgi:ribosomal protein S18 acetylase RimI-like enzyme
MIVRPYEKKDLKRCQDIAQTDFIYDEYLNLPNHNFLVIENDDGFITGFGVTQIWEWNRSCWIVDINIDPLHRNRGYGRALVKKLADMAKRNNSTVLIDYFPSDFEHSSFYFKLGFKICGYNSRLFYDEDPEKRMGILVGLDL